MTELNSAIFDVTVGSDSDDEDVLVLGNWVRIPDTGEIVRVNPGDEVPDGAVPVDSQKIIDETLKLLRGLESDK
ncbi:hypothetical protein ACJ73_08162, partial [Blastomyces percursus]